MKEPHAELRVPFESEEAARRMEGALKADDDAVVSTRREGTIVIVAIQARDLRGLLRAVDDVLASMTVSEDVIKSGRLDEPNA